MNKKKTVFVLVMLFVLVSGFQVYAMPDAVIPSTASFDLDFLAREGKLTKIPVFELGLGEKALGLVALFDYDLEGENGFAVYLKQNLMLENKVLPGVSAAAGLCKFNDIPGIVPAGALLFTSRPNSRYKLSEFALLAYSDQIHFSYSAEVSYYFRPGMAGNLGIIYFNDFQSQEFVSLSFGVGLEF